MVRKPMKKALFNGLTLLASYFGDSYDSENEAVPKNGVKKRYRQNPSGPGESLEQRPSKMPKLLPIYQDTTLLRNLYPMIVLEYTKIPFHENKPDNTNIGYKDCSKWAPLDLSNPALLSSFTPLDPQPMAEFRKLYDDGVVFTSLSNLVGGWNGWPSGRFAMNLTHGQFVSTKALQVNWATRNSGGDRTGQSSSPNIYNGKVSSKQCLGLIHCTSPDCQIISRPRVKSEADRIHQLSGVCSCGPFCNSKSHLICWGQIGNDINTKYRHINGDAHIHSRLPHVIHFSKQEEEKFFSLVNNHPSLGPAALVVGPKTITGFGPGAADVAQAARNPDFVAYQRRKIKSQAQGGHSFLRQFSAWQQQHPGVVRTSITNEKVSIVSIQTEWIRDRIISETVTAGPLNGMVSDGAHGYWNHSSLVLIITSTFSKKLQIWVPNLFTYSDGTSSEHYRYHFKGVFQSIAELAELKGVKLVDEMFEMVVDFSDPQREGYEKAFIDFWMLQEDDARTQKQLKEAVGALLKGCEYHYEKSVTRVSRAAGIIPVETRKDFVKSAKDLMTITDPDLFEEQVNYLNQHWKIKPWLTWWTRPDIARMIFASQRLMNLDHAQLLPNTTNAEESMHAKIYALVGKHHELIPGLDGLLQAEKWHHSKWDNAIVGIPNHYGKPALYYRNNRVKMYGHSKKSRHPAHRLSRKNKGGMREGRAPDDLGSFKRKTYKRKMHGRTPTNTTASLKKSAKNLFDTENDSYESERSEGNSSSSGSLVSRA
ncbi:hypothetical protein D9757_012291 [Collybiopsis confluens]|uniref:GCM domain-containing protein n=1 Tax=Collybiopsis confluens TaxID=2823264 RepID=A0A8H5LSW9_9AGAR|nr:hypothetical protein D9757_012291 [Collybiopsis confluens]